MIDATTNMSVNLPKKELPIIIDLPAEPQIGVFEGLDLKNEKVAKLKTLLIAVAENNTIDLGTTAVFFSYDRRAFRLDSELIKILDTARDVILEHSNPRPFFGRLVNWLNRLGIKDSNRLWPLTEQQLQGTRAFMVRELDKYTTARETTLKL